MAAVRLFTFLPRSPRALLDSAAHRPSATSHTPFHLTATSPSRHQCLRRQSTQAQRYGSAAEPLPNTGLSDTGLPPPPAPRTVDSKARSSKPTAIIDAEKTSTQSVTPSQDAAQQTKPIPASTSTPEPQDSASQTMALQVAPVRAHPRDPSGNPSATQSEQQPNLDSDRSADKVRDLQPPSSITAVESRSPHFRPPQYVHHFDTYTLVKELDNHGFSHKQSTTFMKLIRGLLADNLALAKEGLVSKSDIENESYLFRAACSEMRTDLTATRKSTTDKMRTERAHLQQEADVLGQRVTQDLSSLKDQLRGMFDDRKMAVRSEQRAMDSAIAELNYKITTAMQGDARSEVEGLRWFLARRAALALAGMAVVSLATLRYATYMSHLQEQERAKLAAGLISDSHSPAAVGLHHHDAVADTSDGYPAPSDGHRPDGVPTRNAGTQPMRSSLQSEGC